MRCLFVFYLHFICDLFALARYPIPMKPNPLIYCNFIIHSQIEYSVTEQSVVMRCTLEMPATGRRSGFTDVEDLLSALRAEFLERQDEIVAKKLEKGKGV